MPRLFNLPWGKKEKRREKPTIELIRSCPLDPDGAEKTNEATAAEGTLSRSSDGEDINSNDSAILDPDYASLEDVVQSSSPELNPSDSKENKEGLPAVDYLVISSKGRGESNNMLGRQSSGSFGMDDPVYSVVNKGPRPSEDTSSDRSSSNNSDNLAPNKRPPFSTFGVSLDAKSDLFLSDYFSGEDGSWGLLDFESSPKETASYTPEAEKTLVPPSPLLSPLPLRDELHLSQDEDQYRPGDSDDSPGSKRGTIGKKSVTFNDNVQKINRNSFMGSEVSDQDLTEVKRKLLAHELGIEAGPSHRQGLTDTQVATLIQTLPPVPGGEDSLSIASEDDVYSDVVEEEDGEEKPRGLISSKSFSVARTVALMLAWFCMGLYTQLGGPTLPYMMHNMNTTYEETSRTFVANGCGILIGSVVGGLVFSFTQVSCDIILAAMMFVAGVSTVAPPWCTNLLQLGVSTALEGLTRGVIYVGSILQLTRIWKEELTSLLIQILFVTYCAGALLSAQSAQPFLDSSNAAIIVEYLHALGIEGVEIEPNGLEETLEYRYRRSEFNITREFEPVVISSSESPAAQRPSVDISLMAVLFGLVAMLAFISALCFLALALLDMTSKLKQKREKERRQERRQRAQRNKLAKEAARIERIQRLLGPTQTDGGKEDGSDSGSLIIREGPLDAAAGDTQVKRVDGNGQLNGVRSSIEDTSAEDPRPNAASTEIPNGTTVAEKTDDSKKNGHVTFQIPDQDKQGEPKTKDEPRVSWFLGDKNFDLSTLLFLYVFYTLPFGIEVTFSKYLFSFAVSTDAAMPSFQAALLLTIFWGSALLGRIVFIFLGRRVFAPNVLMILCLTLNVVNLAMLATYGHRFKSLLWMFTASFGVFLAPIFPAGLTWTNVFLNMCAKSLAVAFAMGALGAMLIPWLAGLIIDYFDMPTMIYLLIAYSCLHLLLYMPVMRSLGQRKVCKVKVRRGKEFVISNSHKTYV